MEIGLARAWPLLLLLLANADDAKVRSWKSPDGQQLYLAVAAPEHGGDRLYYFQNDATRTCYTFSVAGRWKLDESNGTMVSEDGRGSLGQSVQSASELGVAPGADLVGAAIAGYQRQFTESLAALAGKKDKAKPQPTFAVEPFEVRGRTAVKWTASAEGKRKGRDVVIRQHEVLVDLAPGWVLALEAADDVAREAIESLGTAASPECYGPFLREHFPQLEHP